MEKQKMLVVCAHAGDFVRCGGGAIAKYAGEGHEVYVIALSDGIRGEADAYWKQGGGSVEECRHIRRWEAEEAARVLGVKSLEFCGYQDHPLSMDAARIEQLACRIRAIRPDFIITHDKEADPLHPDHNLASDALRTAYTIASGAGAFCNGLPVAPRQTPMFGFEPHMTEISAFKPGLYIDISAVAALKWEAMACFKTQTPMAARYRRKAETRADECAGRPGAPDCRYAEAFSTWGAVCMHGHFVW